MAEAASGGPSAGDGAGPSSMLTWKMLFGSAMAGEMSAMRYTIEIIALQGPQAYRISVGDTGSDQATPDSALFEVESESW